MSISEPLAVTMMIGTFDRVPQLAAHVDARDLRQHHVEQDEVGPHGVEQVERLGAVAGDLHPEPLALQPDGQGLDEGLLVLDDEDRGRRQSSLIRLPASWSSQTGTGPSGQAQGERRPSPSLDVDRTLAVVVAGHVADDGQPEPGARRSPRLRARSTR